MKIIITLLAVLFASQSHATRIHPCEFENAPPYCMCDTNTPHPYCNSISENDDIEHAEARVVEDGSIEIFVPHSLLDAFNFDENLLENQIDLGLVPALVEI